MKITHWHWRQKLNKARALKEKLQLRNAYANTVIVLCSDRTDNMGLLEWVTREWVAPRIIGRKSQQDRRLTDRYQSLVVNNLSSTFNHNICTIHATADRHCQYGQQASRDCFGWHRLDGKHVDRRVRYRSSAGLIIGSPLDNGRATSSISADVSRLMFARELQIYSVTQQIALIYNRDTFCWFDVVCNLSIMDR